MYPSHELGPIPDATDALRDQICNLMPAENLIPERWIPKNLYQRGW
jgi:hypothetical protein